MRRIVYTTLLELAAALKSSNRRNIQPYRVSFNGEQKFALSGNSDQAIAAVARALGAEVETIPISDLLNLSSSMLVLN